MTERWKKKLLGWGGWIRIASIHALQAPARTYAHGKALIRLKVKLQKLTKDSFLIAIGILAAGFGLRGFLLPSEFIDGGAVGISLLLSHITHIPLSILLVLVNIPFIILGLNIVGKEFALKTIIAISLLALAVAIFPYPVVTADKLLVSVFGGFFLGAGIGFAVRGGGVLDGTEVLAIYMSRRLHITIGDVIILINTFIFAVAAWLLSIETAMYSMLTYLAASRTVNFLIEGIEEYTGVTIISVKSEDIRKRIIESMGRGVTIYKGERGYGRSPIDQKEIDIIFTVITRLEVSQLHREIESVDPNAFVIMNSIKDTKGGMIKKRPLTH